jgi:hypothetical protein
VVGYIIKGEKSMNRITNNILITSKAIKVKDKVDKILKKYPIDKVLNLKTHIFLRDKNIKTFLKINNHSKILKSPFLVCDKAKSSLRNIPNSSYAFVPAGQALDSQKTIKGLIAKDTNLKIGKFYKIKKIALYVDFDLDDDSIKEWLKEMTKKLIPTIQHEWVHIEQYIRSRQLKDTQDEGVDFSKDLTETDLINLSKHQQAIMTIQDSQFLINLKKEAVKTLKKQIEIGLIDEESFLNFREDNDIKAALSEAAQGAIGMQEYQSRKSEVMAYAVQCAEYFLMEETASLFATLSGYIVMSIESPKIKKKFFRFYSEALQERGVLNSMISEHVNHIYSQVKNSVMEAKHEAEKMFN